MSDYFHVRDDVDLAQRDLEYLARFLVDLRAFWPLLTTRVIGWISRNFETEGSSWTGGWEPLSVNYAAWKSVQFPGKGILSMYGDLRRAATTPNRTVTPNSLTLTIEGYTHSTTGKELDPGWFQEGTNRMPARPLIGEMLTPEMEVEVHEAADIYIDGLIASIRRS